MAYKINAHNQLGLAPAVALNLGGGGGGGGVARIRSEPPLLLLLLLLGRRRVAGRPSIAGRAAGDGRRTASHDGWRVAGNRRAAGVDGRGTANHLRRGRAGRALVRTEAADGAGGTGRVVCRVAGRSRTSTWMIHLEARLGRVGCSRRDGALARGRREERRYLRGSRGRARALQQAGAGTGARQVRVCVRLDRLDRGGARLAFTKTKAFQARVQRTHKGMVGGRIREGDLKGKRREGGGQQAVGAGQRGAAGCGACSAGETEGVERLWCGRRRAGGLGSQE